MFLAMFDMPDVARVFCPEAPGFSDDPRSNRSASPNPAVQSRGRRAAGGGEGGGGSGKVWCAKALLEELVRQQAGRRGRTRTNHVTSIPSAKEETIKGAEHLPPLYELIEGGKVLALNMPAGINPALARAPWA